MDILSALLLIISLALPPAQRDDTYYRVYLPVIGSNTGCIIRDAWNGTCHLWPYIVNE